MMGNNGDRYIFLNCLFKKILLPEFEFVEISYNLLVKLSAVILK